MEVAQGRLRWREYWIGDQWCSVRELLKQFRHGMLNDDEMRGLLHKHPELLRDCLNRSPKYLHPRLIALVLEA